jgi:hypothetical protein
VEQSTGGALTPKSLCKDIIPMNLLSIIMLPYATISWTKLTLLFDPYQGSWRSQYGGLTVSEVGGSFVCNVGFWRLGRTWWRPVQTNNGKVCRSAIANEVFNA